MRLALVFVVVSTLALAACGQPSVQTPVAAQPSPDHSAHKQASLAPPKPLRAGERFVELAMERPFKPAPDRGTDEYRCFLLDPKLAGKEFITGSQFLPQNMDLVHHAIFFRVPQADVKKAQELDAKAPGDGWTCFSGTGIERSGQQLGAGAAWIAAWAPGGEEVVLDKGIGYEMAAGSQIVMQIHYNLLATNGKPGPDDKSGIRLRVAGGKSGLRPLQTTLLPAPIELPCTNAESGRLCDREKAVLDVQGRFGWMAGAAVAGLSMLCSDGKPKPGPVQTCDHRVREAGSVYAAAGHMHLLGRTIKIELNPGTRDAKVLLDVPVYNFDDQGARPLVKPVALNKGDVLRVTCRHDAGLRKLIPSLQSLEPRYVVWGEGTADEMCLGVLNWVRA